MVCLGSTRAASTETPAIERQRRAKVWIGEIRYVEFIGKAGKKFGDWYSAKLEIGCRIEQVIAHASGMSASRWA